jgi:tetratricopeptide (TPR) repeat protein
MRPPVRSLVVALEQDAATGERAKLLRTIATMLPFLDWRGHVLVIGDPTPSGATFRRHVVALAARHLRRTAIATLHLHPTLYLAAEPDWRDEIHRLTGLARALEEEAYRERSDPRLRLHPILVATRATTPEAVAEAVQALREAAAAPSLLLPEGRPDLAAAPYSGAARIHTALSPEPDTGRILDVIAAAHVVDAVAERRDAEPNTLSPCPPHLLLCEGREGLSPCFEAYRRDVLLAPGEPYVGSHPGLPEGTAATWCPACIASSLVAGAADLAASGRRREATRACLDVARAFAAREDHATAAQLAGRAAALAEGRTDRAAALLLAGLSHRCAGELDEAEEALKGCRGLGDDPGWLAYQRGEVQFAWRDWIEALERYEEALRTPSPALAPAHVHFRMALCHVNLEEYSDARRHLDAAWDAGPGAPVAFYRGVCALNEGSPEEALEHFLTALDLDPAEEDLGRILFFQGAALKELGHWEEAVAVLQRGARVDPVDLPILNLLGFCLYTLKRHAEAAACFRRAVEVDPRSAIDWANLGSNLRDLGRKEEAIAAYTRALELDPTIEFARSSLARLRGERPVQM